jgi:GT2 family glycosyltransferase
MNKTIAIVILNYKNWQDTVECLESVFACTYQPCRVIVVDNDSQNDSLEHIAAWLDKNGRAFVRLTQEQSEKDAFVEAPLVLIQSAANRGYSAGNNIGIRWAIRAGDPYALILNNDTVVEKDFLQPLAAFLETHPDTAMVGPSLKRPDGSLDRTCARIRPTFWDYFFRAGPGKTIWPNSPWRQSSWYFREEKLSSPQQVEVLSGSCLLIRCDFLEAIGLLDENTFLFAEEYILAEQAIRAQKHIYMITQSSVIHKHGQSIRKRASTSMMRYAIESHIYYLSHYRQMSRCRIKLYLSGYYTGYLKQRLAEKCRRISF